MKVIRVLGLLLALALWVAVGWLGTGCVDYVEPTGDTSLCERASPSGICCGVYGFAQGSSNELGHWEQCVLPEDLELAESMHGPARPSWSPRFTKYTKGVVDPQGFSLCVTATYQPKPDEPVDGCNAYDGCFCPEGVSP